MLVDRIPLVKRLVRDDEDKVTANDIESALTTALKRYSKDRPDANVIDQVGSDSKVLALPSSWQPEFSVVQSLEYPIGEVPASIVDTNEYWIYESPTGQEIHLSFSIASTESVRISHTIRRELSHTVDTIRDDDEEAVACYAASILCEQLAAEYSGDSDSSIGIDNVDHGNKAREFALRAKTLRKRYMDEMGVEDKRSMAAGAVVDIDQQNSLGRDRLTHPNRYR